MTVHVPLFSGTPEPVEAIALVSKAAELVGLGLALRLGALSQLRHMIRSTAHSRIPAKVTGTTVIS